MPHLRVNGVDLHYEFHGPEGGELLVLNNGIFMSTAAWGFQLPELACSSDRLAQGITKWQSFNLAPRPKATKTA